MFSPIRSKFPAFRENVKKNNKINKHGNIMESTFQKKPRKNGPGRDEPDIRLLLLSGILPPNIRQYKRHTAGYSRISGQVSGFIQDIRPYNRYTARYSRMSGQVSGFRPDIRRCNRHTAGYGQISGQDPVSGRIFGHITGIQPDMDKYPARYPVFAGYSAI